MKTTRAINLSLARYMNSGHNRTADKVRRVVNSNYLSKMALGDMDVGNYTAVGIENALELPGGWLDRNNSMFLKLTEEQHQLLALVIDLPKSKQLSLATLLTQDACSADHLGKLGSE